LRGCAEGDLRIARSRPRAGRSEDYKLEEKPTHHGALLPTTTRSCRSTYVASAVLGQVVRLQAVAVIWYIVTELAPSVCESLVQPTFTVNADSVPVSANEVFGHVPFFNAW